MTTRDDGTPSLRETRTERSTPALARRRLPLRGRLALLVAATALPLLAFGFFGAFLNYQSERENVGRYTLQIARSISQAVEADHVAHTSGLQALALTRSLQANDLEAFRTTARAYLATQPAGSTLGLADETGQLTLALGDVPRIGPLPKRRNMLSVERVFATATPIVSDLFSNAITGRSTYTIDVPVMRDDRVVYDLGLDPTPAGLAQLLKRQQLADGWIVSVIDPKGAIVARRPDNGQFVGRMVSPQLLPAVLGSTPEGILDTVSLEGSFLQTGFHRDDATGWSVAVGVPYTQVRAPLWRAVNALLAVGMPLLLLSLALATYTARRVAQPIAALTEVAMAGRSKPTPYRQTGLEEVDEVGRVLAAATAELTASEARLRLILDTATDHAIITIDLNGSITSWSNGARLILGWNAVEATGHHFRLIFTPEAQAAGVPELEMQAALAQGRAEADGRRVRRDGSHFWADGVLVPMRDPDSRVIGFVKILRDRTQVRDAEEAMRSLTEQLEQTVEVRTKELSESNVRLLGEMRRREESEDQLRQLQKMDAVGQLTGGIAHDFNNMLAIVIGSLNLMQKRLARGETPAARHIDAAMEGATRAATLTQRLLAFSRQQPLAPIVVDANRLVAGMSELLRRTLGEETRLETVLAGGLWAAHVDASQLENALLNLAVNGRDAMSSGGRLTIETANCHLDEEYVAHHPGVPAGQYVMLAVTDTGAGMSQDIAAKAFDPFFTTKAVGRGTGLGLSQVYGFVRQSGGHIKIYSEPGQGTTVKVYLPRFVGAGTMQEPTKPPLGAPQSLPSGNVSEIILVVEDEDRVRDFTVEALRELGYTVVHANGAVEALRQLDAYPDVTILLTDIVMPDVNGRKLADEALRRRPDLKVMFATGYTRNAVVHNGVLDHGVNLITKPFTLEQLATKVRKLLD